MFPPVAAKVLFTKGRTRDICVKFCLPTASGNIPPVWSNLNGSMVNDKNDPSRPARAEAEQNLKNLTK